MIGRKQKRLATQGCALVAAKGGSVHETFMCNQLQVNQGKRGGGGRLVVKAEKPAGPFCAGICKKSLLRSLRWEEA